ncbi:hypothetical protein DFR97_004058 [Clostridium beijerinckii]|nr:hypothetical protein [Clostridium beijerinckii]NRZ88283.1 hypothetical protein [Clostridium beijerinckii]
MKMAYLDDDPILLEPFKLEIKKLTEKNDELKRTIEKLNFANEEISNTHETLDEILAILDNFKQFYDFTEDFEEKKRLIKSLVKYAIWNSRTRTLELILIGSDKERPKQGYLPLSDSNRRNGPCRNNCYNGISTYGKCNYRRDKKSRTCWALC